MTRKDFVIIADFFVQLYLFDVLQLSTWKDIVKKMTITLNLKYDNFKQDTFFKYINKRIWIEFDWK